MLPDVGSERICRKTGGGVRIDAQFPEVLEFFPPDDLLFAELHRKLISAAKLSYLGKSKPLENNEARPLKLRGL